MKELLKRMIVGVENYKSTLETLFLGITIFTALCLLIGCVIFLPWQFSIVLIVAVVLYSALLIAAFWRPIVNWARS
jgi:hypothetical protein